MKKRVFLFLLGIGVGLAVVSASTIRISVRNRAVSDKVLLIFSNQENKEVALDASGNASITLNDFKSQYVRLQYGEVSRLLYLDSSQDLSISFDGTSFWKDISFAGPGASINSYLNSNEVKQMPFDDKMEEQAYIQKSDSLYQANLAVLETAGLPGYFVEQEKERLKYYTYAKFPIYPTYYAYFHKKDNFKATEAYYRRLRELIVVDADLLCFEYYREFMLNAIPGLCLNGERYESLVQLLQLQLEYIGENIKDAKVREYLVSALAFNFVKDNGVDEAAPAIEAFGKYVEDEKMTSRFNSICNSWRRLSAGNPSPVFSGETIDGKTVSLSDLKGKYVYIDVWATWCMPCRGELPYLKKLEEKYKGKEIEFVSLSCDQNKEVWRKMIEKEELKGIQLCIGSKSEFMKEYMISGIPRFILLDKEGKIISATMSRPSQSETITRLDALLE